jgi:hypothetical protein
VQIEHREAAAVQPVDGPLECAQFGSRRRVLKDGASRRRYSMTAMQTIDMCHYLLGGTRSQSGSPARTPQSLAQNRRDPVVTRSHVLRPEDPVRVNLAPPRSAYYPPASLNGINTTFQLTRCLHSASMGDRCNTGETAEGSRKNGDSQIRLYSRETCR